MLASISRPAFAAARSPLRRTNQLSRSFSTTRSRFSDKTSANNASSSSVQPAATSEPLKKYNDQTSRTQNPRSQTVNGVKERLRVWATRNATALRQRMDTFSASAQIAFSHLGGRLNEVTGYREIEQLKNLVVESERKMTEVREAARVAKEDYEKAVARRANSQREVNDLLQRKSSWTDVDVMRFTELVRQDHLHEQEEAQAKTAVAETDSMVETQFNEMMRAILSRYHEEQVWSDKIRSASTYGSLAALGLNLAVFVLAIVLVEPWKRRRLVQSFETRVLELNARNQAVIEDGLKELREHQAAQEKLLEEIQTTQAVFSTSVRQSDSQGATASVANLAPTLEDMDYDAKASRDRQIIITTAAGAFGAGLIGWLMGSRFG